MRTTTDQHGPKHKDIQTAPSKANILLQARATAAEIVIDTMTAGRATSFLTAAEVTKAD